MRSRYIVKDLLATIGGLLEGSVPRSSREAQLFLMEFLKVDELWLITNRSLVIEEDFTLLFEWVKRRKADEPFEYIVKHVSFYSQDFYIDKGALIPRPETELLIDEVCKNLPNGVDDDFLFAEVGVGSGIVSIVLAQKFPNAKFIATDISSEALRVAKINIDRFNLNDRIELRCGSLLECVDEDIDYLVSNPPYIANGFKLEKNLSYEPQNALFGGEVGDEIVKKLLDEVLQRGIKYFSCEMGYDQKAKIEQYLELFQYEKLEFYVDYSGFDRGFTLKL